MTEIDLLIDFHKDAERQGPGSEAVTRKALEFIELEADNALQILDIGCGTGGQTMTIAQRTNSQITAVDLFPAFLEKLEEKARQLGLSHKMTTLNQSMDSLAFDNETFDVIWSEGAIYIYGFEKGVTAWRKFIKPGGYLAVSEISWLTNLRPKAIEQYWAEEYAEIDTVSNKTKVLEENGYSPVAHFILPEYCWIDNYYQPMERRFEDFLKKHNYSEEVEKMIEANREEIAMYLKYKEYYSYGFYIAKKIGN